MVRGVIVSANARAVWRLLRDEGGYWTPAEVAARLVPEKPSDVGARNAGRWLASLATHACVVVKPATKFAKSYGVTSMCLTPDGESMECTS